jgi:hypothetical protein
VILRVAAALSLLLGVTGLLGFLFLIGKGPLASSTARHMRAMKDRVAAPDSVVDVAFTGFAALPHHAPLPEYAAIERRGVRLVGYVQKVLTASDGDIHLEVADGPAGPEWPHGFYVTAEITPQWRRGSDAWVYERLVAAVRPGLGGSTPWDAGARRVRISGWLLYDYQYDLPPAPWLRRVTGWEIHPVTGIELWDDSLGAFAEYRR